MQITRGAIPTGQKVIIYGPEGIGKTTLAAQFPGAVFIDTEGSTKNYDVARLPTPSSWEMLKAEAEYPLTHPGEVGTLIIDTADWAEKLCNRAVCAKANKAGIEDFGYGKGYTYAAEEFGRLLDILERLTAQGIHVVITAHAQLRKVEQPDEMSSYDRWELKCSKQLSPILKEWADMVLFCNYKTMVVQTKDGKGKAQGSRRVMYTTHNACWDAKNRVNLSDELDMDWRCIAFAFAPNADLSNQYCPPAVNMPPAPLQMPPQTENMTVAPPVPPTPPAPPVPPAPAQMPPAPPNVAAPPVPSTPLEPIQTPPAAPMPAPKTAPLALTPDPPVVMAAPPDAADLYAGIDPALADLMRQNNVSPQELQQAVSSKGYLPAALPVSQYPADFVAGCLVAAWPQVLQLVQQMRSPQHWTELSEADDDLPF